MGPEHALCTLVECEPSRGDGLEYGVSNRHTVLQYWEIKSGPTDGCVESTHGFDCSFHGAGAKGC